MYNLEEVMEHSEGEMSSKDLLESLRKGDTQLWLYKSGWLVINLWGKWIDFIAWWDDSKGRESGEVVEYFYSMAESLNLRGIRFVTSREPSVVERRSSRFGFRQRMVEYIKEVM